MFDGPDVFTSPRALEEVAIPQGWRGLPEARVLPETGTTTTSL